MDIIGNIPIYYINLNRSTDRNTMLLNTFKEYGITNYKRVEAIDGTLENFKDKYTSECSNKEIACSLSHIKAIENAYNDNCNYAIIMEDDCNFEYLDQRAFQMGSFARQSFVKLPTLYMTRWRKTAGMK